MSGGPDGIAGVFRAHLRWIVLAGALLLSTMLAGVALLGLSGGFLTAAALTLGVVGGFNFFTPSAGIRALTLARIVSRYGEKIVGHVATLRIARDLRVWFFARASRLTATQLGPLRTGDLLARLLDDIAAVDGWVVRALGPLFALVAVGLAGIAAAALWWPPAGVWLALVAGVIGIGVPWLVARGRGAEEMRRADARAGLRAAIHEYHDGAADLAAMQADQAWLLRLEGEAGGLARIDVARRRRLVHGNLLHAAAGALGLFGMLWLVGDAVARDSLRAEHAAALFFMTMGLLEAWAGAGLAWQSLQAARASARRLEAVAMLAPAVADPPMPVPPPARGELAFEGVVFAWADGGRRVLDGADLRIAPGERVAIRGDSGSGKSTLSALAMRGIDPLAGRVCFGGVDLRAMAQARWHARIAWLPQSAPVFAGSVRANLAFGADADDARMRDMLAMMRLDRWLDEVGGLDAWIGEHGATMSAGQARRLALARALLRDAPLVLLDEPTEGLDHDTADGLLRDLPAYLQGRSLLLVTHGVLPPGTVHREYVLQAGRLRAG